jgi:hypothetical protein
MNPFVEGAGTLSIQYGNSLAWVDAVTIRDTGNVGIGTSSLDAKLHVLANGNILTAESTGTVAVSRVKGTSSELAIYTSLGETGISAIGSYPLVLKTVDTERMRITATGDVGIGTASPSQKLTVFNGTSRTLIRAASDLNFSGAYLGTATSSNRGASLELIAHVDTANSRSWRLSHDTDSTSDALVFSNADLSTTYAGLSYTERMRLDASGNLLVGTTSASTPVNGLAVEASAGGPGIYTRLNIGHSASAGAGEAFTRFLFDSNVIGSITRSGASAVSYNTSSDARLKHDIVDAPDAASLIDAIKVRSFKWNADDSEQRYGFVAQELVEVAPEAVSVPADEDEMMGVDYSKLVPMLVKELQSVRARLAQLEGN